MDQKELINNLKSQHRTLQKDLSDAMQKTELETENIGEKIVADLTKFKNDLMDHLKLENGTFYPDYLDKKIKRGEETESTKTFMKEMDDIARVVLAFLEKYSAPESINSSIPDFKNNLSKIIGTLNTRIETEEEGIFDIYLVM